MRAMILAAGYGTRLWPLTVDRAKSAIPILGRPLVAYVVEYLARYGFSDIIINLHHSSESVRSSLGNGARFGVSIQYVEEPAILGTSGAIDNARNILKDGTFLVVNGKIISDIDISAALETHRTTGALATLVLRKNVSRERFSIVEEKNGIVTGFGGMPSVIAEVENSDDEEVKASPLMFTGIQILEPRIFSYIPPGVFSHSTTDVYPKAMAAGERISAHIAEGSWSELSTIPRYLDVSLELLSRAGANVQRGCDCWIHESAEVRDVVLWDGVRINRGAQVQGSVIADGVEIPEGARILDAAVVRADLLRGMLAPPKALKGAVQGANFVVPLRQ